MILPSRNYCNPLSLVRHRFDIYGHYMYVSLLYQASIALPPMIYCVWWIYCLILTSTVAIPKETSRWQLLYCFHKLLTPLLQKTPPSAVSHNIYCFGMVGINILIFVQERERKNVLLLPLTYTNLYLRYTNIL